MRYAFRCVRLYRSELVDQRATNIDSVRLADDWLKSHPYQLMRTLFVALRSK